MMQKADLKKTTQDKMSKYIAQEKKAQFGRCHLCSWYFKSESDYKKYKMFC